MAARPIVSFELDEEGHWVARLGCGHTQHVRHRPPMESRPWITSEATRASRLGTTLECLFCEMPELPPELETVRRTKTFDEDSVPAGLLAEHRTRADTWGVIHVERGRLRYETFRPPGVWVLVPQVLGIIAPAAPHRVVPVGSVRFHVEFLRPFSP